MYFKLCFMSEKEKWGSKIGVILVVASGAIGLGNFLRFPGQAAKFGGGAFMIPYIISFLLLGLPVCLSEWIMGRMAGEKGHSSPKVFSYFLSGIPLRLISSLAILIPVMIYTYYVFVEAWCLAYAVDFFLGNIQLESNSILDTTRLAEIHFQKVIGSKEIGDAFDSKILPYIFVCYLLNFFLVFRGISKGLEKFAKFAVPVLLFCSVLMLVKVFSLENISLGLGRMWNPDWSSLKEPKVWIAACGQIFFSLSVGFGIVLTLASYLDKKDDVILSGLSAASLNEFVEVVFGGLITIPVGFLFLGASVVSFGTFGMGFIALPTVFTQISGGFFFGGIWFLLLFIAAITSSVTMIQPGISFLEEGFHLKRKSSSSILFLFTFTITLFIVYFNKDLTALDHTDFWVGTFLIYILSTIQILIYGWKLGPKKGQEEGEVGSLIKLPFGFNFTIKYITPVFLISIFIAYLVDKDGFQSYIRFMTDGTDKSKIAVSVFVGIISIYFLIYFLVDKSLKKEKL